MARDDDRVLARHVAPARPRDRQRRVVRDEARAVGLRRRAQVRRALAATRLAERVVRLEPAALVVSDLPRDREGDEDRVEALRLRELGAAAVVGVTHDGEPVLARLERVPLDRGAGRLAVAA